jgi:hypothetical protein
MVSVHNDLSILSESNILKFVNEPGEMLIETSERSIHPRVLHSEESVVACRPDCEV